MESKVTPDGRWELMQGGPHVEKLERGTIIFNHKQTEDLLKHGKTNTLGKAFASGTAINGMPAHASTNQVNYNPTGSGGSITALAAKQVGATSATNQLTNAINNMTSAAKKGKNGLKKFADLFDWIEIRIRRLQDQIDLYTTQANNKFDEYTSLLNEAVNRTDIKPGKAINARNSVGTGVNDYVDQVVALTKKAITANAQGADKYASTAKNILAAAKKDKVKNADTLAKQVREGKIDVTKLSKKQKEFVDLYQGMLTI